MNKKDRVALFKAYENYLSAFNDNDIETINDCVQYPLAYIGAGTVSLLDDFPISPADIILKQSQVGRCLQSPI